MDAESVYSHVRVVRLSDEDELKFWMRELGASDAELLRAVRHVGSSARLVEAYLSKQHAAPSAER